MVGKTAAKKGVKCHRFLHDVEILFHNPIILSGFFVPLHIKMTGQ